MLRILYVNLFCFFLLLGLMIWVLPVMLDASKKINKIKIIKSLLNQVYFVDIPFSTHWLHRGLSSGKMNYSSNLSDDPASGRVTLFSLFGRSGCIEN